MINKSVGGLRLKALSGLRLRLEGTRPDKAQTETT